MPQTRSTRTVKLPNGNRVSVTVGSNRHGCFKTVTVRRPDGTGESRTYRRGPFLSSFLGGYSDSIPAWAKL
jgi:hypothetical protein